jgi:hypothetical protein
VVRARAGGEEQSALATHRISFAMEGFEPQLAFPVDRVGVFVLPLRAPMSAASRSSRWCARCSFSTAAR